MAENRIASRGVWVGVSKSCCMTYACRSVACTRGIGCCQWPVRWRGGPMARWADGAVARWRGGAVA
eukprot:scaffold99922_cov42-Phaeocystis_antarctica.AAC.1